MAIAPPRISHGPTATSAEHHNHCGKYRLLASVSKGPFVYMLFKYRAFSYIVIFTLPVYVTSFEVTFVIYVLSKSQVAPQYYQMIYCYLFFCVNILASSFYLCLCFPKCTTLRNSIVGKLWQKVFKVITKAVTIALHKYN